MLYAVRAISDKLEHLVNLVEICESKCCKWIKERGIRYKTEKILNKNLKEKNIKPTLKKQMSRRGLEPRTSARNSALKTTALSRPAMK